MAGKWGSEWKTQGAYNWVIYAPMCPAQAFRGSPVMPGWSIVWWFPGKDAVLRVFDSEAAARESANWDDPSIVRDGELRDPASPKEFE